jgi:NAD(P)-dependent dehydrogenase (short-subunit alcohol dehydrogenase family)
MSPYCASKAAVEALGNSLRIELRHTGARVGVAYFAELATDMTTRGFATEAAARMPIGGHGHLPVAPVEPAIDALERGIARRSRRIVSPGWVAAALPLSAIIQRLLERQIRGRTEEVLEIARGEKAGMTTPQPPKHP